MCQINKNFNIDEPLKPLLLNSTNLNQHAITKTMVIKERNSILAGFLPVELNKYKTRL